MPRSVLTSRLAAGGRKACGVLLLALGVVASGHGADKSKAPLMSMPQPVRDLYYGDALFYFYQDDFFQSLVRMDAAITQQRVGHHQTEAELIKGALYLSLGQHVEAGRIFQALLNDNVAPDVRNRAWFYLGKLWYQRGYYAEAERALNSIAGALPARYEPERRSLMAQVLMAQGRFDDAITALQTLTGNKDEEGLPQTWAAYARFNLGVALLRLERVAEGARLLDAVGQMQADTDELLALRDKANLALGFTWLKQGDAKAASAALERVRLQGPQSDKALLGLGWAQSREGNYREALAPWLELKQRNLLDPAVQEAYLAIPYAYAQLNADGQAANFYNFAIDSFEQERVRIDQSIAAIQGGSLINTVLDNDKAEQSGWHWQLTHLKDAPETRYLYDLLASHTFQEALKNYRDLKQMQRNLAGWLQSVDSFDDMVDTRRQAFAERDAAMHDTLDGVDIAAMEAQVVELESRTNAIEASEDAVALGTPKEQTTWRKLEAVQEALRNADASDPSTAELRDKLRLMRGVVLWEMSANYKARLWRQKKEVRELAVAVKEARRRYTLVTRARDTVPQRNEQLAARVTTLKPRLEAMIARSDEMAQKQGTYLAAIAVEQLRQQQQRLAQYTLQARFSLASIYDRAANAPDSKSATPRADATSTGATP